MVTYLIKYHLEYMNDITKNIFSIIFRYLVCHALTVKKDRTVA